MQSKWRHFMETEERERAGQGRESEEGHSRWRCGPGTFEKLKDDHRGSGVEPGRAGDESGDAGGGQVMLGLRTYGKGLGFMFLNANRKPLQAVKRKDSVILILLLLEC